MGKRLLKHVLPLLLAVAMIATSVPANVLAADLQEPITKSDEKEVILTDVGDILSIDVDYAEIDDLDLDSDPATDDVKVDNEVIKVKTGDVVEVYKKLVANNNNSYIATVLNKNNATGKVDDPSLKDSLVFAWQKMDGTAVDGSTVSTTAGEYKLVITAKEAGIFTIADDATTEIKFNVEATEIYVYDASLAAITSGEKVADVKKKIADQLKLNKAAGMTTPSDDATLHALMTGDPAIVIAETYGEKKVLADEDVLVKGTDYTCTVTYTLTEEAAKGYKIADVPSFQIVIGSLKKAKVTVDNTTVTRPYTGSAVAAPVINGDNAEVKVKVVSKDETDPVTGENKDITPATITGKWYTVNGEELKEAPTEVGTYKYEIICFEDDKVYYEDWSPSTVKKHEQIDVVITPISIVLEPVAIGEFTVLKGQKAADVERSYTYKITGADVKADEKFFGVTYNDPSKAQYYQPLFALQMASKTIGSKDEFTNWAKVNGTIKFASGPDETTGKEYAYRIVFTGEKGIYTNGEISGEIPVNTVTNTAQNNYVIDLAESYKKTVAVDVKAGNNAEFKIDDIIAGLGGKGISVNSIYRKVYDHEPLYANRKDYKKARFFDISANAIVEEKNLTGEIEYNWYIIGGLTQKEDNLGNPVYDDAGKPIYEDVEGIPAGAFQINDTNYNKLPKNAGMYCLQIHYNDIKNDGKYVVKDSYVYFEIERQIIKVVPSGTLSVYSGTTVESLVEKAKKELTYKFYKVPGNDITADVVKDENLIDLEAEQAKYRAWVEDDFDKLYEVTPVVEVGDNLDATKANYSEIDTGSLALDVPYRVSAELDVVNCWNWANYEFDADKCQNLYANNYTNHCTVKENDTYTWKNCSDAVPVEVKKAGEKALKFTVDATKAPAVKKVYDGTGIDVAAAVANGYITAQDALTGEAVDVKTLNLTYKWDGYSYDKYDENNVIDPYYVQSGVSPVHAQSYTLAINFEGNDTYMAQSLSGLDGYISTFAIEPKEITINLPVKADIEAGLYDKDFNASGSTKYDITELFDLNKEGAISGYIDADAAVFGNGVIKNASVFFNKDWKDTDLKVGMNQKILKYDDKTTVNLYRQYKNQYGVSYCVAIAGGYAALDGKSLKDRRNKNYTITIKNDSIKANKHGRSAIFSKEAGNTYHATNIAVNKGDNYTTVITAMDGIPYYYGLTAKNGKKIDSANLLTFGIHVPYEFNANYGDAKDKAAFENQIESAGGYVLNQLYDVNHDDAANLNEYIAVAFPVTEEKSEFKFQIKWPATDDFTETFEVKVKDVKKQLEANLMEAVAPKSLAFNGAKTKMAVGETQALDVKMTKLQSTDVVELRYEADGAAVSVDKTTGVVTALKSGKATVKVYPVKRDAKGEIVAIPAAKSATVSITVKDVTAPKVSNIFPYDTGAEVTYSVPADGYRREVYVLEGKKTVADFETAIKAMEDSHKPFEGTMGAWFYTTYDATEDNFVDGDWADYVIGEAKNKKGLTTIYVGGNLDPNKAYTVYVRNVSAVRTLEDGKSEVAVSAKGTVKTFTTKKMLPRLINITVPQTEFANGHAIFDKRHDDRITFDLNAKKINLETTGVYALKKSGTEAAADNDDYEEYKLPLSSALQKTLYNPKLTYYALDKKGSSKTKDSTYTKKIGNEFFAPSKIANIGKNGELTLKGVGTIYIYAYDASAKIGDYARYQDRNYSVVYAFDIKTDISALKGKTVKKAKVGDTIDIYDYVDFINAKTNKAVIAKPGIKAFYPVTVTAPEGSKAVTVDGSDVTINDANQSINLDVALKSNPSIKTTVTIKTAVMDAIKNLKAVDVVDDQADFIFKYTSQPNAPLQKIKVDVRDARGSLMSSQVFTKGTDIGSTWTWDHGTFNNKFRVVSADTKADKGQYTYRFRVRQNIVKKSNYNVTVTPIFGEYVGKAATAKFKTTDVPYSHENYGSTDRGGIYIYDWPDEEYDWRLLNVVGYLTSGDSYNLMAMPDNDFAYTNKTDKLTWTVKDKKVATVKVLPGTCEAVLTANMPGDTQIEIKSGITKKVIAIANIRVKTVGDGLNSHGKDVPNNDDRFQLIYDFDTLYDQSVEVLTEANQVRFYTESGAYDYRWVMFEAPCDGNYQFSTEVIPGTNTGSIEGYVKKLDNKAQFIESPSVDDLSDKYLAAGEKLYIKVSGIAAKKYVTVTVSSYGKSQKVALNTPIFTEGLDYIDFVAPADGFYRIASSKANDTVDVSGYGTVKTYNEKNTIKEDIIPLTKGDYTLSNLSGNVTLKIESVADTAMPTTETALSEMKKNDVLYYSFKAAVPGKYKINLKDVTASGTIQASIYKNGVNGYVTYCDFTSVHAEEEIIVDKADTTIWVKLVATVVPAGEDKTVTGKLSLTVPEVKLYDLVNDSSVKVTVPKNGDAYVKFVIPENDTEYTFSLKAEEGKTTSAVNKSYTVTNKGTEVVSSAPMSDDKTIFSTGTYAKNNVLTIKLTDNAAEEQNITVAVASTKYVTMVNGEATVTLDGNKPVFVKFKPVQNMYEASISVAENSEAPYKLDASQTVYYSDSLKVKNDETLSSGSSKDLNTESTKWLTAEGYMDFDGYVGKDIMFAFKPAANTNTKTSTAKVTLKPVTTKDLTLGENTIKLAKDKEQLYTYKVTKDGYYYVTTSYVSSEYDITVDDSVDSYPVKFVNGEVITVKAKCKVADKEAKVTIYEASQKLPSADFKLNKEVKTNYYSFTAPTKGRYVVNFKAVDPEADALTVKSATASTTLSAGTTITNGKVEFFNVGDTKYYYVEDTTTPEAKVSLTVKPVETPDLKVAGEAMEVKAGETNYYKWTVPATGRYNVKVENTETTKPATVKFTDKDSWKANADSLEDDLTDLSEEFLTKGDEYYVEIASTNNTADTVKVTIKAIEYTALELDKETTIASLAANEVKWYKLDATEGWYKIETTATTGVEYSYAVDDVDMVTDASDISEKEALSKAQTFYVKVSASAAATNAKIKISKIPQDEIKVGDNTISLKDSEYKYGKFKATETGYYKFGINNVAEEITYANVWDEDGYFDIYANDYTVVKLNAGETLYLTATADVSVADAKSFTLEIKKVAPEAAAELGKEVTKSDAKVGDYYFYTFSAPEDGRYYVEFAESTLYTESMYVALDENGSYDYANYYGYSSEGLGLKAGQKVAFAIKFSGSSDSKTKADVKFTIKKHDVQALTAAETEVEVKAYSAKWLKITATENTKYYLSANFVEGYGSTNYYKDITSSSSSTNTPLVRKGDSYYILLKNNYSTVAKAKVKVEKKDNLFTANNIKIAKRNSSDPDVVLMRKTINVSEDAAGSYKFRVDVAKNNDKLYNDTYLNLCQVVDGTETSVWSQWIDSGYVETPMTVAKGEVTYVLYVKYSYGGLGKEIDVTAYKN